MSRLKLGLVDSEDFQHVGNSQMLTCAALKEGGYLLAKTNNSESNDRWVGLGFPNDTVAVISPMSTAHNTIYRALPVGRSLKYRLQSYCFSSSSK